MPISALSIFGTIAVFEVAPAAATMTSRSRASAMVLIGLVCQVAQTFSSLPMLPSHLKLQRVVVCARIAEQRIHGRAVGEGADHRAVAIGAVVKRAGGSKPSRCRHVLRQ